MGDFPKKNFNTAFLIKSHDNHCLDFLNFFSWECFFSRSAFWCLIFPFLMLSSATFKLDFWLLNSNLSSSIFYFWVCNTSCSFFFIYCSSFSLDWISFCISRSATYLLWTIFKEEISSREIGKFVTHTTQQTSSFTKRNDCKAFYEVELPCTSKRHLLIENPRSRVLFPWLRDKIHLTKQINWVYFCKASSLNTLPTFLQ